MVFGLNLGLVAPNVVRHDGQGRVMMELARALTQRGHRVTVYSSGIAEELPNLAGLEWRRISLAKGPALTAVLAFVAKATRALDKSHDLVCVMGASAFPRIPYVFYGCFAHIGWRKASRRLGILPSRYHLANAWINERLERRCASGARRLVAMSEGVAQDLVHLFEDRVTVVPGGVDLEEFPEVTPERRIQGRRVLNVDQKAFVIAFVGEYATTRKGLARLMGAAEVSGDRNEVLLVQGPGPVERTRRQFARAGILDRVRMLEPHRPTSVTFAAADVVAVPSLYEPFSLVALEGAASGLPVVISRSAGAAHYLEDGGGAIAIDDADVESLRSALDRLKASPSEAAAMGRAARRVAARLSWPAVSRQGAEALEKEAAEVAGAKRRKS